MGIADLPFRSTRAITVKGHGLPALLGQSALTLSRLKGQDGINTLFVYDIELKTPDSRHAWFGPEANSNLQAMQGKELTVEIEVEGSGIDLPGNVGANVREITGIVHEVQGPCVVGRQVIYRLTLRPWLWLATRTTDYKIFQQKTVVEILDELLADYNFPVEKRLDVARYPRREYQVQYGETDYAFFKRLTEKWGISYYFEHSEGKHRLVLSDGNGAFRRFASPAYHTLRWYRSADRFDEEHLFDFQIVDQLVSGKWTANDYDFGKPRADLTVAIADPRDTAHADGKIREWPGTHAQPATDNDPWREGDMLARIRMEAIRQHGCRARGRGYLRGVVPGCTFRLAHHPIQQANREYLVFAATLELEDVAEASGQRQQWSCEVAFDAQPTDEIFRPDLIQERARTFGPQTATVVGPDNHTLWVDQFGRVKIQFHWDRIGQRNEHSSCWVRAAQSWQGYNYGASHLPRIGQEVIVDFLTGNADCPIITGRVANRVNMPPWNLPSEHALSGFRSRELFGERHNTFVQDDTQGEIQTQIGSDHQASTLSMGYMVRIPNADGRREKRGEGFELRTDGWGAVRGGAGLLFTTDARNDAQGHHKALGETAGRLLDGEVIQRTLGKAGDHQRALAGEQIKVADALRAQHDGIKGNGQQSELSQPALVLASPAGIAASACEDIHLHSAQHTAVSTGEHIALACGKSFVASVAERLVLFARKRGLRFIAAKGKIEVQAQNDDIEAIAQKVLRLISAQERIEITSPKGMVFNAAGSYLKVNGGGIEYGTPGTWTAHASTHELPGPQRIPAAVPTLPDGRWKLNGSFPFSA
ncbi:type VI secretion system Vgr family protein [Cupriavidus oxalaticus]|uniref:type VI secretion system Vgr family protein n=1 Tax=Cupriavidus oxalaticus TaxID=96344 RepID=UPI00317732DD